MPKMYPWRVMGTVIINGKVVERCSEKATVKQRLEGKEPAGVGESGKGTQPWEQQVQRLWVGWARRVHRWGGVGREGGA